MLTTLTGLQFASVGSEGGVCGSLGGPLPDGWDWCVRCLPAFPLHSASPNLAFLLLSLSFGPLACTEHVQSVTFLLPQH